MSWQAPSTAPPSTSQPTRRGPDLALVLALLSVPGSTIAWALPAGGLWIGLPLGLAARGARPPRTSSGSRYRMATSAVAIGALAIGQMVVWTVVSARS